VDGAEGALDEKERRLAARVPDHPVSYIGFEGVKWARTASVRQPTSNGDTAEKGVSV
jgi:hypothetical protein